MCLFHFFSSPLYLEEEGGPREDPLGRLLLRLEVERPDVGRPPLPRLVDGAVVEAPELLLVLRHAEPLVPGQIRHLAVISQRCSGGFPYSG